MATTTPQAHDSTPSGSGDEPTQLRAEVRALAAEVTRLREQQTVSAEVLRVVASSPSDLQPVLQAIVDAASRLCDTPDMMLSLVEDGAMRHWAACGPIARAYSWPFPRAERLDRQFANHRAVLERRTVHVDDALALSPEDHPVVHRNARRTGYRTVLGVPLQRGDRVLGALNAWRMEVRPFTAAQIALLESFADQAVIAVENARLFSELQESNQALTEQTAALTDALERQTATAEILRVMSQSPAEVRPVLDAICESAVRLTGAANATLRLIEGEHLRMAAHAPSEQLTEEHRAQRHRWLPQSEAPPVYFHRALWERRLVHVHDLREDVHGRYAVEQLAWRTVAAVPLLRRGEPLGVLAVRRTHEVRPFGDDQLRLLETYADQAVIAIENARLFQELNERNATLKDALEQQSATTEILRVIASTPAQRATVLGAIADRATRLCEAEGASIYVVENGRFVTAAQHPQGIGPLSPGESFPMDGPHLPAVTLRERRTIVLDVARARDEEFPNVARVRALGLRHLLAIPLVRDTAAVGTMTLRRTTDQAFTPQQIALAEMFASQAVIAIENARLFDELQERDERRQQELERAASIQQRLLPSLVEGWPGLLDIAVRFRPAVETSGDFYDVLPLTPARPGDYPPLQIAVGDVAGKGMSAALVTALARSALRSTAAMPVQMATPANTLRLAGNRLHEDVGSGHFVACALAVVEPPGLLNRGPLLRLANAAQVPVLLCRGGDAREIEPPGDRLPLGARPDGGYEDAKAELRLGDVVVFSSDGLVEAPARAGAAVGDHLARAARAGELFGFPRLAAAASHWSTQASTAKAIADGLWADLTEWCGEESHHDDMTLLVLRVPEPRR